MSLPCGARGSAGTTLAHGFIATGHGVVKFDNFLCPGSEIHPR